MRVRLFGSAIAAAAPPRSSSSCTTARRPGVGGRAGRRRGPRTVSPTFRGSGRKSQADRKRSTSRPRCKPRTAFAISGVDRGAAEGAEADQLHRRSHRREDSLPAMGRGAAAADPEPLRRRRHHGEDSDVARREPRAGVHHRDAALGLLRATSRSCRRPASSSWPGNARASTASSR